MAVTPRRALKALQREASKLAIRVRESAGGERARSCPACGARTTAFYTYGGPQWGCLTCNASPRERLMNLCLQRGRLQIRKNAKVLYIAPGESSLVRYFEAESDVTFGDLHPEVYPNVDGIVSVDLMDLSKLPEFDLIYASHVLEHVHDDKRVMRNILDRLTPDGQAWLLVPMLGETTVEGGVEMSAMERERHFGQWDHVRMYGEDFLDRLTEAGFTVRVVDCTAFDEADVFAFGLAPSDRIFVCSRR